jgi:hypothetical protein
MNCRSGCKTRDHASYAECLQAANVRVNDIINSPYQGMYETTKRELRAYQAARRNGIQPGGTTLEKVRQAEAASQMLGRPYDGNTDPPADMIVTKKAARFVNSEAK